MDFGDFLKKMASLKGKPPGRKIKTVKPTPEEINEHMQLDALFEVEKKAHGRAQSATKLFWAKVETRLGEFVNRLHWNTKTNEIEIYQVPDDYDIFMHILIQLLIVKKMVD